MVSYNVARVFKIMKTLNRRKVIPAEYWEALEERLIITFNFPTGRQKDSKIPRSKEASRLRYVKKKAQKVYTEILEDYPHFYIPFILAISPKACEKFDIQGFRENHDLTDTLDLKIDVRGDLEELVRKGKLSRVPYYIALLDTVFPQVSSASPKPITSAETNESWAYHGADVNGIRNLFTQQICDAIEEARKWANGTKYERVGTTKSVWMNLPKQNYQDAMIALEVCLTEDVMKILFPSRPKETIPLFSVYSEDAVSDPTSTCTKPNRQKASVSAVLSIFGTRIWDAIEKSQLRNWEKENSWQETTDCVSMETHKQQPCLNIIRVRIGFVAGTYIANSLYA